MNDDDQDQPDWWQAQHLIEQRQAWEKEVIKNKEPLIVMIPGFDELFYTYFPTEKE